VLGASNQGRLFSLKTLQITPKGHEIAITTTQKQGEPSILGIISHL